MTIDGIAATLGSLVWGRGTIGLILFVGIWLSIRTRFVQVRRLCSALKYMIQPGGGEGEISPFGALCASLAATVGTGNIVGVSTAIVAGGPGALLWMVIAGFFGMATKYAEGLLAIRYREKTADGRYLSGPFLYIEKGLGSRWRPLSKAYALFGAAAGLLGVGTMIQINGITSAVSGCFDPENRFSVMTLDGRKISAATVLAGAVTVVCAAPVIFGGIKRLAAVSQVIVPLMAGVYVAVCITILLTHFTEIPKACALIFRSAFEPAAVGGAVGGLTLKTVIQKGVGRGVSSNEAGLGTAAIAAGCARTQDAERQGLVTMTAAFIDTCVICVLTGLSVTVTGAWDPRVTGAALDGADVTACAWRTGLPTGARTAEFVLTCCLCFFAYTTIVGWSFFGERCLEYLCGQSKKATAVYRILYLLALAAGPYLSVRAVWNLADVCNGMMALPNLIALLPLSGKVARETSQRKRKRKKLPFDRLKETRRRNPSE